MELVGVVVAVHQVVPVEKAYPDTAVEQVVHQVHVVTQDQAEVAEAPLWY